MGLILPRKELFLPPKIRRVTGGLDFFASGGVAENFGEEVRIVFYQLGAPNADDAEEVATVHMPRAGFDRSLVTVAHNFLPLIGASADPLVREFAAGLQ